MFTTALALEAVRWEDIAMQTEELDSFALELIAGGESPREMITSVVPILDLAYIVVEADVSAFTSREQIYGMEKLLRKVIQAKIMKIYGVEEKEAAAAANVVGQRLWRYAKVYQESLE
jgi:hypothetical protein